MRLAPGLLRAGADLGYGGAGGRTARYLSGAIDRAQACLDLDTLTATTPDLVRVAAGFERGPVPPGARTAQDALDRLRRHLDAARKDIPGHWRNGLGRDDNPRLFAAVDTTEVAELMLRGLRKVYEKGGHPTGRKRTTRKR